MSQLENMELTSAQHMIQQILNEAWSNTSFKAQLLANPLTAIQQLTGLEVVLPPGKTLMVLDQTDTDVVWLRIPPKPSLPLEEELETRQEIQRLTEYSINLKTVLSRLNQEIPPTKN